MGVSHTTEIVILTIPFPCDSAGVLNNKLVLSLIHM